MQQLKHSKNGNPLLREKIAILVNFATLKSQDKVVEDYRFILIKETPTLFLNNNSIPFTDMSY